MPRWTVIWPARSRATGVTVTARRPLSPTVGRSSWRCRDRQASFDPQLIAKYQRRFPGFDDKIISMYARGMSTPEIVGHLHHLDGIDLSPDLISAVTDAGLEGGPAWEGRPLE